MNGWLRIAGLGPGAEDLITPQVLAALDEATDVVGYRTYVDRVPVRDGVTVHATPNRVELERAQQALRLAADGRRVVVVSSGDPGVFAMAAAVFEAVEAGPPAWRTLPIEVLPGVTAMLAAAARVGAPLGHDFCVINLSDNLKPWTLIERRLELAAEADFAIALYNPRSRSRPDGFARARQVLLHACGGERVVVLARAISTEDETVTVVPLAEIDAEQVDMRTVVLVGSSRTRVVATAPRPMVYTPRSALP